MESREDGNESGKDSSERNEIRSKLSNMSFEELQKLKDKLGSRVYKEAVFGSKSLPETEYKRLNKNRPREASSKIKPTENRKLKVKEKRIVDPRFDRLCGTFNEKHFQNTYEFLTDIRKKEKRKLAKMLKKEKNPKEADKIKYLLQRMENQDVEVNTRRKQQELEERERQEQIKALESGKKPYFKTKYEKKVAHLLDKYSDLKKSGKIKKYIEKKQKKQKIKEKRKRYFEVNIPDD